MHKCYSQHDTLNITQSKLHSQHYTLQHYTINNTQSTLHSQQYTNVTQSTMHKCYSQHDTLQYYTVKITQSALHTPTYTVSITQYYTENTNQSTQHTQHCKNVKQPNIPQHLGLGCVSTDSPDYHPGMHQH